MIESIIKPKAPKGSDWVIHAVDREVVSLGYPAVGYLHKLTNIFVISAVEVVVPDDIDRGPEYHISISKNGGRCTSNEAKWVLRQFNLEDAEEDNHVPHGIVRNFWLPVAENIIGHECSCKETESVMKEDQGDFIWRGINK